MVGLTGTTALRGTRLRISELAGVAAAGLIVARLASGSPGLSVDLMRALIGIGLVLVVRRAPWVAAGVLLVGAPMLTLIPAGVLAAGAPIPVARGLGATKDVVVVGVLLAALQHRRGSLDTVEKLGLAYIGIVLLYLVVPFGPTGLDGPPFQVRLLGGRLDTEWLVLALSLRRLPRSPRILASRAKCAAFVAAAQGAACVYQYLDATGWNHFVVNTLQLPRFQGIVQGVAVSSTSVLDYNTFGGISTVRVAGLSLSTTWTAGMCMCLACVLVGIIVVTRSKALLPPALAVAVVALILTLTRSAVGGLLVGLVVIFVALGRFRIPRTGFVLAGAFSLFIALPLGASAHLFQRISAANNGSDPSAIDHQTAFGRSVAAAFGHVLGFGLGTAPGVGYRFSTSSVTAEDGYIQAALELGLVGGVLFIGLLLSLIREARRTSQRLDLEGGWGVGVLGATVSLAVMTVLLDPWVDYPLTLIIGILVGVGLPVTRAVDAIRPGVVGARASVPEPA